MVDFGIFRAGSPLLEEAEWINEDKGAAEDDRVKGSGVFKRVANDLVGGYVGLPPPILPSHVMAQSMRGCMEMPRATPGASQEF